MMPSKRTISLGGCAIIDKSLAHKHRVAGKIELRYNGDVKELTLSVRVFRKWGTRACKPSIARCVKLSELRDIVIDWLEDNQYECRSPGRFYLHGTGKKRASPAAADKIRLFKLG